ncbi:MAG: AMP-binding protein, partial [Myxococcota bacterium]|nr:AMP-binding protein [Myxococcota bacterium]
MPADTIPSRLRDQAQVRPQAAAYHVRQPGPPAEDRHLWTPTSWSDYNDQVRTAARSLIALGLENEQTTCILGFNRPEWAIFDMAAMSAGGIPAGIYETCSPEEVQYIIDHSGANIVLVESVEQWEKLAGQLDQLPSMEHVVTMEGCAPIEHDKVMSWDSFLARGADIPESAVDERIDQLQGDQLATLIYTSGTTGPPKAVMLTHHNLAWTAKTAIELTELTDADCNVSYLPLSHIAEQLFTLHAPVTGGGSVYFAQSREALLDNLKEVQPTVVFGVPRVWEKFHAGVSSKLALATGIKVHLVAWARRVGTAMVAARNSSSTPSASLRLQYRLADKLIFSKLKPALGLGGARICVSGAAPIAPDVLEFFASLDLVIHEVYGQSEDTGPTTFNRPGSTRYGTVGQAFPGVDVKIADDGEILVRGPNVFRGYYKNESATSETLQDGWLLSGDLGAFDDDGFLTITGRKKDIIITAGGKNIAPKNIEAALQECPLISQAVVIGDRRKFLSALLTLAPEATGDFAKNHSISGNGLHENEQVIAALQAHIDEKTNPRFARVEHVRAFRVLPREFSMEDGELTP